jgi:hypothetical protein
MGSAGENAVRVLLDILNGHGAPEQVTLPHTLGAAREHAHLGDGERPIRRVSNEYVIRERELVVL